MFMKVSSMDDCIKATSWLVLVLLQKWISSKVVQPQHSLIPTGGTLCPCSWDVTPRHHLTVGWSSLGRPGWPELLCSGGNHASTDTSNQSGHNRSTKHPSAHSSNCSEWEASCSTWNMPDVPLPVQQKSQTDQYPTAFTVYPDLKFMFSYMTA